ncbi:hypothetical protein CIRMBP1315_02056 [Enterococcus cecorum]|uniref:DUF4145 domain-containing protein n=1 Tax=Enterococcus cecorum TaxID=44008 RepID=UPI000699F62E|nr:DUF4145 domain-containing protein [Enterococcus cecorum]CAI3503900.1 hypothetical protein CIRMBP1315_02056 [Enterococcus cecorum]
MIFEQYIQPAFVCPHCDTIISHMWAKLYVDVSDLDPKLKVHDYKQTEFIIAQCNNCEQKTVWKKSPNNHDGYFPVYPIITKFPKPSPDIPEELVDLYNQAGSCLPVSPCASAALSRLFLEKLLRYLDFEGNTLNDLISSVSKQHFDSKLLDIIRFYGNKAVHTGTLDLTDDSVIASYLLDSINTIVEILITNPAKLESEYNKLPESYRNSIESRDSK